MFGLILVLALSLLFSVCWMKIATHFAEFLISCMMLSSSIFLFVISISLFVTSSFWSAFGFFCISILSSLYYFMIRHKIHFASANLKVACASISALPHTLLVAIGMTGFPFLTVYYWLCVIRNSDSVDFSLVVGCLWIGNKFNWNHDQGV